MTTLKNANIYSYADGFIINYIIIRNSLYEIYQKTQILQYLPGKPDISTLLGGPLSYTSKGF